MAKKQRRKFHQIKIHPNRYLIWACAIALIVTAALVSYIYIGNIIADAELAGSSDVSYWHTYKDTNLTFRYPADWAIDPGTNFVGFGPKNEDAFIVYTYSPPNDPAYDSYSKLASTKKISVGGIEGIRIPDQRDASQRIAFVKTSTRLYEFRGNTLLFDQILKTVKFLRK